LSIVYIIEDGIERPLFFDNCFIYFVVPYKVAYECLHVRCIYIYDVDIV
jgi:hypothetical protein